MADQKNHSFISSSKIRKFIFTGILFGLPVIILLTLTEMLLLQLDFAEKIKKQYIEEHSENIKILFLGSSQVERAINPVYITENSINLANSSQTLYEDFQLLKNFSEQLDSLQLVVLEISYDKLERDKSHVSPLLDHKNLKFYKVNTFGRSLKIQDFLLFHSNPKYFSERLLNYFYDNEKIQHNKYGFDENKYEGAFTYANYILIENIKNKKNHQNNLKILYNMIEYCLNNDLEIIIYHPPTFYKYNKLRDREIVDNWEKLLKRLKIEYPELKFFVQDANPTFTREYFYNGNHLNPKGARKATKELNNFIINHYK